jgi:hypothetical protein
MIRTDIWNGTTYLGFTYHSKQPFINLSALQPQLHILSFWHRQLIPRKQMTSAQSSGKWETDDLLYPIILDKDQGHEDVQAHVNGQKIFKSIIVTDRNIHKRDLSKSLYT